MARYNEQRQSKQADCNDGIIHAGRSNRILFDLFETDVCHFFSILVSIKGFSIDTQQYENNKLASTRLIRFSIIFECLGIYRQKVILYDVEIRGSCEIIEF